MNGNFKNFQVGDDKLAIKKSKSILEFDDVVRAKYHGYDSAADLYRNVSCIKYVKNIKIPHLVLHSRDDPVCPFALMPKQDLLKNENTIIIETKYGGHCDFFTKQPKKQI